MAQKYPYLSAAAAGIEHRRHGLIDRDLARGEDEFAQPKVERLGLGGRIAYPERQDRALDIEVLPVNERGELRCGQSHHAIADRRPPEGPVLQSFPEQHQAGPVPRQNFYSVGSFASKYKNCPRKRILTERFAHQRGEPVCTLSKINRFAGHQHPQARRNRDHVAALTARSTSLSQPRSTPLCARTLAPAISITIDPGPFVAASAAPTSRIVVTTGTNMGASSAGRVSRPARAALRQANRCCGVMSCRRATSDTTAPGA